MQDKIRIIPIIIFGTMLIVLLTTGCAGKKEREAAMIW